MNSVNLDLKYFLNLIDENQKIKEENKELRRYIFTQNKSFTMTEYKIYKGLINMIYHNVDSKPYKKTIHSYHLDESVACYLNKCSQLMKGGDK